MLGQAGVTGGAMFGGAGAASLAKAATVLDWLVESKQDPLLGPFLVRRGGSTRRRLQAELELKATLHSGSVLAVRHALMMVRESWVPEMPELAVLIEPIPDVQETMRLLDSLMCLADAPSSEFSKFADLRALNDRLRSLGFAVIVQEEARRRAALVPPLAFGSGDRVAYGLAEWRAGRTVVSSAPRLVSASAPGVGGDDPAGARPDTDVRVLRRVALVGIPSVPAASRGAVAWRGGAGCGRDRNSRPSSDPRTPLIF